MATYEVRSIQHRRPMKVGWFHQRDGEPIPPGEPLNVPIRFLPTDLFVPKGGRVRLTVLGSVQYSKGESMPSGSASEIKILHKCTRPSVLRFLLPDGNAKLLNVRERDEHGTKLASKPRRMADHTGAGMAKRRVCGKRPKRINFLRPTGVARR